ncbi:MAG: DUF4376 domain-containing protein [Thermoplasmataceae archaeon]
MTPAYAIIYDSNGNGTGSHKWMDETTVSLASNEIACTEAQAQNPSAWQVVNGALVESLPAAQSTQKALLTAGCQAAIVGGFTSSALGSVYSYPSDTISQSNQNSAASSLSGGKLWCASGGVWALIAHTQAQAQDVVASLVAWVNSCQEKRATLQGQVNAATSVSAVQAITWVNP